MAYCQAVRKLLLDDYGKKFEEEEIMRELLHKVEVIPQIKGDVSNSVCPTTFMN